MDGKLVPQVDEEAWQAEIRAAKEAADVERQIDDIKPKSYLLRLIAKVLLVSISLLLLLMAWTYADNALFPFDSAAWKANVNREKQWGRLRRQIQLVGMTREQVMQLLGKPTYTWRGGMGYVLKESGNTKRTLEVKLQDEKVESLNLASSGWIAPPLK